MDAPKLKGKWLGVAAGAVASVYWIRAGLDYSFAGRWLAMTIVILSTIGLAAWLIKVSAQDVDETLPYSPDDQSTAASDFEQEK